MRINVEIPNVTIETVKSMGNLTGWTPSKELSSISRDTEITPEAVEQLEYFGKLGLL